MEYLLSLMGLSMGKGIALFGILILGSCTSYVLNYPIKNFEKRDFMNSVSKSLDEIAKNSNKEDK